jgi:TPR repeat protein
MWRDHKEQCKKAALAGKPIEKVNKTIEQQKLDAEMGDADAQYNVGMRYFSGTGGVASNRLEAFQWFTRSAEAGNIKAMRHLGLCYEEGYNNGNIDVNKAFALYKRAAEAGDSIAQFSLGGCYMRGTGVAPDMLVAAKWWQRAADSGLKEAQGCLDRM